MTTLLPEVGYLVGPDRLLGRIVLGLTGFIPLQKKPPQSDSLGQQIGPPHAMLTVTLSL